MALLPYILPLMLGRTFDLNKMTVGVDIFPKEVIANRQIFVSPFSDTSSGLVQNYDDARKRVDVDHSLSLKIKSGIVNAGAPGEYLSDPINRRNTVEVVQQITFTNVTEFLPIGAKPIPNWRKYGAALGTHYVSSITYGGEIISSLRFETNSTQDKENIKAPLSHRAYKLGVQVEDEWMKNVLKSVKSAQMKVFSSVPLDIPPNDMDSLNKAFKELPNYLKHFNEGRGVPVRIELRPLEELDSSRDDKFKERLSEVDLDIFEYKFEDLRNTKRAISDWIKNTPKPLTKEQEHKVGDFYNSLENALAVFHEVIGTLDTSQGSDQLNKAYDAYGTHRFISIFYKKYLQLRQEIEVEQSAPTEN